MSDMSFDQELCHFDNCLSYSNDKMIIDDYIDVVQSMNAEVNSVFPFIECLTRKDEYKNDEDHVVPRRSIFQIVIQGSKQSFTNPIKLNSNAESLLNSIEWNKLLNCNIKGLNDEWTLLYKGSRDGFHSKDFHRLCDNKGPTITLIRTRQGKLFGGYTRISWHSDKSHFQSDPYAFLFSFKSNSIIKYNLIDRLSKYAIWNAPNYGPTFGRGADLFICSQSHINEESYSKLPSSYRDPTGLSHKALAGQQLFLIDEIQVYH